MYPLDIAPALILRTSEFTLGRPYHAALCQVRPRHNTVTVHTHQDFYELFYILSGAGEHRLPTGRQRVGPGDLVLVRPQDLHYLVAIPPSSLEWINVVIPVATWQGALDVAEVRAAAEWHRSPLPRLVSLSDEAAARMESSFRELLARSTLNPRRTDLLRFMLDVFEELTGPELPVDSTLRPVWLVRACTAMAREENLRGGVRRLAQLAGVSQGHLCRSMRAHYDSTPTEFVANLRLRHAEALLATTSLAVTEIADRCGFSSLSYFSRSFHATQGTSPREFRRRTRRAVLP